MNIDKSIIEATKDWMRDLNEIPTRVIQKLMELDYDSVIEITPRNEDDDEPLDFLPMQHLQLP